MSFIKNAAAPILSACLKRVLNMGWRLYRRLRFKRKPTLRTRFKRARVFYRLPYLNHTVRNLGKDL